MRYCEQKQALTMRSVLWVACVFVGISATVAEAKDCRSKDTGAPLERYKESIVAFGYVEERRDKQQAERYVGNAIVFKELDGKLVFMTAQHVLYTLCDALELYPGRSARMSFVRDGSEMVHAELALDNALCQATKEQGYGGRVDMTLLEIPKTSIEHSEHLSPVPSVRDPSGHYGTAHVIGYGPFPDWIRDDDYLERVLGGTKEIAQVGVSVAPGMSGSPVLTAMTDDQYALTGVLIRSDDAQEIVEEFDADKRPMSQRDVTALTVSVLRRVISQSKSAVAPLRSIDLSSWSYSDSRIENDIELILREDDESAATSRLTNYLENLSSIEQIDAVSYTLRSIESASTNRQATMALSYLLTIRNLCFFSAKLVKILSEKVQEQFQLGEKEAYLISEAIETARAALNSDGPFWRLGERSKVSKDVFEYADSVFGLLYKGRADVSVRPEFVEYGIMTDRFLSKAVYDHALVKRIGFDDEQGFEELTKGAIALDENNIEATWALADYKNKNSVELKEVVETYNNLINKPALSKESIAIIRDSKKYAEERLEASMPAEERLNAM